MRHGILAFSLLMVATLAVAKTTHAATLAGDSFLIGGDPSAGEYIANKPFDTSPAGSDPQNPTIPGFTGPWNTGGTGLWRSVAGGLSHPAIVSYGGAAQFQFATEVGERDVKRNLTSPPTIATGNTYWMAALVRLNENDPDFDGYAYAGFASDLDDDGGTQGLRVGVEGDGSEMDLVFRHRISGSAQETVSLLDGISPGDTHLVVIEAMINSDLGGGGVNGNDNINIWVDPGSVANEAALGTPDFSLEDFSLFNNAGLQFLTLEGSDITGAGVAFDEIMLGDELADVVTAAAVPEPGSFALWGLSAMAFCGFLCFRLRHLR